MWPFRRKQNKSHEDSLPGTYTIKVVRTYHCQRSEILTSVPEGLFADMMEWCLGMGLELIEQPQLLLSNGGVSLQAGDSINFTVFVDFNCGKNAMLFKLAFGGVGQVEIECHATVV